MKHSKIFSLTFSALLCVSLLAGCGNTSSGPASSTGPSDSGNASVQASNPANDNQTAAEQLLHDLEGTYQELWPVVLSDKYDQVWLDNCGEYAYWLASGISVDCTTQDAESAIELFCTENLSE